MNQNDDLFLRFSSPRNLKQAFEYVTNEVASSTLPLDPFWTPGLKAIEKLGDSFFNSLSKLLIDGKYQPDEVFFFSQHKENYSIRKLAILTMVDRVVYQALLNPDIMGLVLSKTTSFFSCYPGVTNNKPVYLEGYKKKYQEYWDFQKVFFTQNALSIRGEYDVHCFYDSILHTKLFSMLEEDNIGSERLRRLLKTLLESWFEHGRGIPQSPQVSSVLANYYLLSVDRLLETAPSKQIGFARYMDDISILADSEQSLLFWVEKLTCQLDELGLVLNSKTNFEVISDEDSFDNRGISLYGNNEVEVDQSFLEHVVNKAPDILSGVKNGEVTSRPDLSKLKYYLKAAPDYILAKEIMEVFPKLPSLADIIAKYLQPIGSENWVQVYVLKLFSEHHLFRWQRLWLSKLLLLERVKGNSQYFTMDFRKSTNWELRSIAWMVEALAGDGIALKDLDDLITSAENNFERAIYLSLIPQVMNKDTLELANRFLNDPSLELQAIVRSLFISDNLLQEYAKTSSLFTYDKRGANSVKPPKTNIRGDAEPLLEDDISQTLGFSYKTTHPRKRFVFELKAEGDEIVMMGSILDGKSLPAFSSKRTSAFRRVIKTLLSLHSSRAKEIFEHYPHQRIKDAHIAASKKDEVAATDLVKEKRFLAPLCIEFFDTLVDQGQNKEVVTVSFRSAIDEATFNDFSDEKRKKIAQLALEALNQSITE